MIKGVWQFARRGYQLIATRHVFAPEGNRATELGDPPHPSFSPSVGWLFEHKTNAFQPFFGSVPPSHLHVVIAAALFTGRHRRRKLSPNCGASSGSKFMDPRVSCDIFHTSKFPEMVGTPVIIHLSRIFHYNPSILGYPHLWKTPTSSPDFAKRLEETVAGGHVPHGTSITSSPGKPDNQRDKAGKPEDFTGRSCQLLRPYFVNLFSQRDLHLWD